MTQVNALPVGSSAPSDWWRRVSTAFNGLIIRLNGLYSRSVRVVAANYTVSADDYAVIVDASGGVRSITLPSPDTGRHLVVKKVDASANAVNLVGTVDGGTSASLTTQWASFTLIGAGTGWYII